MINGVTNAPYAPRTYAAPTAQAQPTTTQPTAYAGQPQAPSQAGQMLTQLFSGLLNAIKSLFTWIAGMFQGMNTNPGTNGTMPNPNPAPGPSPTPGSTPGTPPAPAPQPGGLDPQMAAIAQQYNLLPTVENVQAFLAETKSYESNGTLGPGTARVEEVKALQTALAQLGFPVQANGYYDQATAQAVLQFKMSNNIFQSYKTANGQNAVNEYADPSTVAVIRTKAGQTQQPAPPAPPAQPPVQQQPPQPQAPQPTGQGQVDVAAIAKQYNLLASPENVQAFLTEVKSYETDGALGPGSTQTDAIRDLQSVLARWGFQLQATGQYDQATAQAVLLFKQQNGLRQSYKSADGNFAINEYADKQTLEAIMRKLEAEIAQAQQGTPPAQQPAPPVQQQPPQPQSPQPPAQGQVDVAAIAQQYNLLASPENVQAFLAEVKSYETDGALGPGSTQKDAIRDLQTVLKQWGFKVEPNGNFDNATSAAVVEYKKKNGLHQSYKAADGNWAVNEYADKRTLEHVMNALEQQMKAS